MVVAESLCCGTPVIGFKAGGPETIAIPEYCEFVEYGDVDALIAAWEGIADKCLRQNEVCESSSEKYNSKAMCISYKDLYYS